MFIFSIFSIFPSILVALPIDFMAQDVAIICKFERKYILPTGVGNVTETGKPINVSLQVTKILRFRLIIRQL